LDSGECWWLDFALAGELAAAGAARRRLGALRLGKMAWFVDSTIDGLDQLTRTYSVGFILRVDLRS
jgi:hypothetical protein